MAVALKRSNVSDNFFRTIICSQYRGMVKEILYFQNMKFNRAQFDFFAHQFLI